MEGFLKSTAFIEEVGNKSGQPINLCFHCQKCASGCSMARFSDYSPNQILRFIQMGMKDRVLGSSMIWICSGCEICGARCPNGIKMSEVMDTLKEIAIEENVIREKNILSFHDTFLKTVAIRGRVHDLAMMAIYKLRTKDLFTDMDLGMKLFFKGKLPLMSKGVKNKKQLKLIFKRSAEAGKKGSPAKCSN